MWVGKVGSGVQFLLLPRWFTRRWLWPLGRWPCALLCGSGNTSSKEIVGGAGSEAKEKGWSGVQRLAVTLLHCQHLIFPQDPQISHFMPLKGVEGGKKGHSCSLASPSLQHIQSEMGGSSHGVAIQTLSFGGEKAKEKHVFIT